MQTETKAVKFYPTAEKMTRQKKENERHQSRKTPGWLWLLPSPTPSDDGLACAKSDNPKRLRRGGSFRQRRREGSNVVGPNDKAAV